MWKRGQGIDGGGQSCNEGPPSPPLGKTLKHLYECEHFHHIVNLFNISVYSNSKPSFIETWYHISSAISRNIQIFGQKQQLDSALFLGVSLHQTTESRPQCRHQSHQTTKSFQIGPIVLLFIFSALLIVYVGLIIA